MLNLFFENSVMEETHKLIEKLEYFHEQHTLFAMTDKRKYRKILTQEKKEKLGIKPTKLCMLNLRKVRITTKGNGSVNMNMGKGSIAMNIMMTLIPILKFASSMALQARKHLCLFVSTAGEKSEFGIIIVIIMIIMGCHCWDG